MQTCNDRKICFIICSNNQQYLEECLLYLSLLKVPKGYETEVLAIQDASSMTAGYNEGMKASDAKYKVYLHQDTFITEKTFLEKILRIFQKDKSIGMIGMIGAPKLSKDGVMWHKERCGNFYRLDEMLEGGVTGISKIKKGWQEVEAVDGLLMATQYDLPWREDILKGWDSYDVSQCLEFRRKGYKIVVPAQKKSWTIHACGAPSYWDYEKNRQIILREYPEIEESAKNRRILFLHSQTISLMGIPCGLLELEDDVFVPNYKITLSAYILAERELIEEELEEGHYDLVCTYDFCPSVSAACESMKVKYLAWVYDSPLLELYMEQAKNSCNYIMVFDKKQWERLQSRKLPHLFHLPLATEVGVFGDVVVTKRDEKKYKAEVSFVGRLYNKRGFEQLFEPDDEAFKLEAEQLAASTRCEWKEDSSFFGKSSKELVDFMSGKEQKELWELYDIDRQYYCESMRIARKCNEMERVAILNKIAEKHQVVLYTEDTSIDMLPNVTIRPWVDYWGEMPKVFYISKINLNITSRSIESGIPQRIFDIMAVGGFVLTNYQPELEDYFEIGVDLEVFHDMEEMEEKIQYYLTHEEQRVRIGINGYKKVREKHTYKERLMQALQYIEPGQENKTEQK